jgi:tripartite-type tricarboxylate transporter receptor subunit TctC
MEIHMQNLLSRLALLAAALTLSSVAIAQEYPNKAVKVVVPYPPGSGLDRVARLTAERLSRKLEQPFVVENKSGAGGNIGADFAFKSAPDGYTVMVTPPSPLVINKTMYSKLPYDPEEFVPVSIIASLPNVLVVTNRLPVENVAQLLAYANANPNKLNYASQGAGTTPHLTGEMFKSMSGAKIVHVPYKGVAPALTDLIGGQVEMMFADIASALPHIRAGKVKALAVGSTQRTPLLPNTPTMAETIPGFSSVLWYAMAAPPKTPPDIVNKLAATIGSEMKDPGVVKILNDLSMEVIAGTPAEARAFMRQEAERWGTVIRTAKITAD